MPHTPYPPSFYAASANPAPERPPLRESKHADVCVIGAGYTGLSAGLFLAEQGYQVVVLEAARVGFGASGRNGGQIVNSYSREFDSVERSVSVNEARLIGAMAFEGGRIIRDRITRYGIQCDLKNGGVFAAFTHKQMHHLEQQKALWERYGYGHSWKCSIKMPFARSSLAIAISAEPWTSWAATSTHLTLRWARLRRWSRWVE
ncbi:hypothetical protein SSTU70S_02730 [Stutzerimonas stutzeri]